MPGISGYFGAEPPSTYPSNYLLDFLCVLCAFAVKAAGEYALSLDEEE